MSNRHGTLHARTAPMPLERARKNHGPSRAVAHRVGRGRFCAALLTVLLVAVAAGHPLNVQSQDDLVEHRLRVPLTSGTRSVTLWVRQGFEIGVAATEVPSARMIEQSPTGELVVSQMFEGKVAKLTDRDGDGVFDERTTLLRNLEVPHGLAFIGDALYVATTDQILRVQPWWDGSTARAVAALPSGGKHVTRTLAPGPDGMLYVSIGSSCDACIEDDPRRAAILRLDPMTGALEPVASGIRNAVGMTWSPYDGRLWVTDNGRNDLGDDVPPDEIDVIRTGGNYGWPDCVGDRLAARPDTDANQCAGIDSPALTLPAHIAPLGLAFYEHERAPADIRGDLLVALHGSAERSELIGYELVRIPMRDGHLGSYQTLVRGWLVGDDSWGRPVAPIVARDGTVYLSDDKGGVIYWIRPEARRQ